MSLVSSSTAGANRDSLSLETGSLGGSGGMNLLEGLAARVDHAVNGGKDEQLVTKLDPKQVANCIYQMSGNFTSGMNHNFIA